MAEVRREANTTSRSNAGPWKGQRVEAEQDSTRPVETIGFEPDPLAPLHGNPIPGTHLWRRSGGRQTPRAARTQGRGRVRESRPNRTRLARWRRSDLNLIRSRRGTGNPIPDPLATRYGNPIPGTHIRRRSGGRWPSKRDATTVGKPLRDSGPNRGRIARSITNRLSGTHLWRRSGGRQTPRAARTQGRGRVRDPRPNRARIAPVETIGFEPDPLATRDGEPDTAERHLWRPGQAGGKHARAARTQGRGRVRDPRPNRARIAPWRRSDLNRRPPGCKPGALPG